MPGVTDLNSYSRGVVTSTDFLFVTPDRTLLGSSRSAGAVRWTTRGPRSSPKGLIAAAGAIIYPGISVAGFEPLDGSTRWSLDVASSVSNCDASSSQATVVVCSPDWNVTAINASSGAVCWSVSLRDSLNGLPTLIGTAISGDTVYAVVKQLYSTTVGFAQAIVFALSMTDGHILSVIREGNYTDFVGYVATPIIVGRLLILPHLITNRLTGIDRFTGRVVWRLNGDLGWAGFARLSVSADGIVYAASADRRVYAVDAASGAIRWKSEILEGSQELASPCGNVVITWTGLNVRVLDRATGSYLGIISDDVPDIAYNITSPPLTDGNELFVRSQKEYRKYTCQ